MSPVAKEILRQMGGNRFIAMTGAKQFVYSQDSLQFAIGRNQSGANKIRVTLTPEDLYKVEFFKYSPSTFEIKTVRVVDGVYNDNLTEVFTRYTGLDTRL
jgi:hypothetical protein